MKKLIISLAVTLFITTFSYGAYLSFAKYSFDGQSEHVSNKIAIYPNAINFIIAVDAYLSESGTGLSASALAKIYYGSFELSKENVSVCHSGVPVDPDYQKHDEKYYYGGVTDFYYQLDVVAASGTMGYALASLTWW